MESTTNNNRSTFPTAAGIMSSPNARLPPPRILPSIMASESEGCLSLRATREMNWSCNRHPFLPFVPRGAVFSGPLFGRLSVGSVYPLTQSGDSWQLEEGVAASWYRLERALYWVYNILSRKKLVELDFALYKPPRAYGYLNRFIIYEEAKKSARLATFAFFPLFGLVSWTIARAKKKNDDPIYPQWVHTLIEAGAHPEWVQDLRQSFLVEQYIPRAGVIINPWTYSYPNDIPLIIEWGIPVYICWGTDGNPDPLYSKYHPTKWEVKAAIQMSKLIPDWSSGQRAGEPWRVFFERKEKENRLWRVGETVKDELARLQREKVSNDLARNGSRVFLWQDVDGFLMRLPLDFRSAKIFWSRYPGAWKRFDADRNEWDLCAQFEKDAPPDPGLDANDDDDPAPISGGDITEDEVPGFLDDLQDSCSPRDEAGTHSINNIITLEPLHDVLRLHYGLNRYWGTDTSADWGILRKTFGDTVTDDSSLEPWRAVVTSFFTGVVDKQNIPDSLRDITEHSNATQLIRGSNIEITSKLTGGQNGKKIYLVNVKGHPQSLEPWHLCLEAAAAAVFCLRANLGNCLADVARNLLSKGIAFQTMMPVPADAPPTTTPKFIPHTCTKGMVFGAVEYRLYEDRRDSFLRGPRSRAALLAGGIVWRLALEVLGKEPAIGGPSDDALINGTRTAITGIGEMYDDQLTPEEEAFICGVYRITIGEIENVLVNYLTC